MDVNPDEIEVLAVEKKSGGMGMMLAWLVGIFVISFLLFMLFKPTYVQNAQGELDYGKVSLASLIIALVIVIIIAMIWSFRK